MGRFRTRTPLALCVAVSLAACRSEPAPSADASRSAPSGSAEYGGEPNVAHLAQWVQATAPAKHQAVLLALMCRGMQLPPPLREAVDNKRCPKKLGPLDPALVSLIEKAARNDAAPVRLAAVDALFWLRAPQAVGTLTDALSDKVGAIRGEAASALGQLRCRAAGAVPSLEKRLSDPHARARAAAAQALGFVRPASDRSLPRLVQLVTDPDVRVRKGAIIALAEYGERAAPAVSGLASALRVEGLKVQSLLALIAIGPDASAAAPAVEKLASNASAPTYLRARALHALCVFGDGAKARKELLRLRTSKDASIRSQVYEALPVGSCLNASDVSLFTEALSDEGEAVALRAAQGLGAFGPKAKAACPKLETALKAAYEPLAGDAALALAKIDPTALSKARRRLHELLSNQLDVTRGNAATRLAELPRDPETEKLLLAMVSDDDAYPRRFAVEALSKLGADSADVKKAFERATKYPDVDVQCAAEAALAQLQDKAPTAPPPPN